MLLFSIIFLFTVSEAEAREFDNEKSNNYHVIIIGAGASGIAAGAWLAKNGISNFTILEAADRVGGRIHSYPFGNEWIELGAQFIHGQEGNVVYEMAKNWDVIYDQDSDYESNGDRFVGVSGLDGKSSAYFWDQNEKMEIYATQYNHRYDESVGEFMDSFFATDVKTKNSSLNAAFNDYLSRYYQMMDAIDNPYQVSFTGSFIKYKELPGNTQVQFRKGQSYLKFLENMVRSMPAKSVKLKAEVRQVEMLSRGCLVTLRTGKVLTSKYIIFTPSLGFLKVNQQIFVPPLPASKSRAIENLNFGTVDKIFLRFPYEWWPKNSEGFSFLFPDKSSYSDAEARSDWTRSILGAYRVLGRNNILLLWISGAGARHMESLTDPTIQTDVMEFLRQKLLDTGVVSSIPNPIDIKVSRWHENPLARGSYSSHSVRTVRSGVDNSDLAAPYGCIFFAGEASHSSFFSTVHGAVETGRREAKRVLDWGVDVRCRNGANRHSFSMLMCPFLLLIIYISVIRDPPPFEVICD